MYWYFKYPLIGLAVLVLFGCSYLVWQRLPATWRDTVTFRSDTDPEGGNGAEHEGGDPVISAPPDPPDPAPNNPLPGDARPPRPVSASVRAQESRRLELAETHLAKENLVAARKLAEISLNALREHAFSPLWLRAADIISRANTVFLNSDAPCPEKVRYIIQQGDTLSDIATAHGTTIEVLQRCNGLDAASHSIYPGDVMHIYKADWNIVVSKPNFVLLLRDGERLVKHYHVATGRQDRTPAGIFRVKNKQPEPDWDPPGKHYPYGHPENVLGTRWLGLEPIEGTNKALRGYGLHGTWEPESIGTAASRGCIRMLNRDVEELFDLVPIGTRVVIKE